MPCRVVIHYDVEWRPCSIYQVSYKHTITAWKTCSYTESECRPLLSVSHCSYITTGLLCSYRPSPC